VKLRWRAIGDVADLPDYSFGSTALGWWGVVGFMLIEGIAFVLAVGAYFYLVPVETGWPPHGNPPPLLWGTLFTAFAIATELPNRWVNRAGKSEQLAKVRSGLTLMTLLGLALLVVRAFELEAMNVRWDHTAYGSIVWALLALHTFHTLTDVYDTGVLAALSWSKPMDGRRFSDVSDNALYWHFIVWSWVGLYVVIYWAPRWI
jgi:cytochrome c oxidase subunit III